MGSGPRTRAVIRRAIRGGMQADRSNSSREKWVESEADTPLTELARFALHERLELVAQFLPRAAGRRVAAVEDVHQLRVSTRRTASALKVFGEFAARNRVRDMRRILGDMRRAAGEARDLDVLYMRLAPRIVTTPAHAPLRFLNFVLTLREAAQRPLAELLAHYDASSVRAEGARLIKSIRWRSDAPEPTMAEAAHLQLVPLIDEFFQATNKDLGDPDLLHQLRISAKRLRYALELFGGAYDRSLREEVYPIFIDAQDHLGVVNDYVTSQARLRAWLGSTKGGLRRFIKQLIDDEQTRYLEQIKIFHEWWTPARSTDLRNRFRRLLGQNGHRPNQQGTTGNETRQIGRPDQYARERRDRT